MERLSNTRDSALGRTVRMRFSSATFAGLRAHLRKNKVEEQFAFGLFSQARTAEGTVLIVRELLLPDGDDLSRQSAAGVVPARGFQSTAYLLAQQRGLGILDIHTHPHQSVPGFSGIDEAESVKNARYICNHFPPPSTHAMLVFDSGVTAHDAVVYDRSRGAYRMIEELEILGRGMQIRPTRKAISDSAPQERRYRRQELIPGWNQAAIGRQRIVVVGAGGNGAQLIQTLVSIGAGTEGWIASVDPDVVEESNLPRIPYAVSDHMGSPKVTVAAQYATRKNPRVRFYPYPCSVTEDAVIDRIKAATLLFGAGDNDGVRKVCNELAVRYQIPFVDLGCDIQIEEQKTAAGGQASVVLPGVNACLVCCDGYDASQAAIDLMDDERAAVHASQGYVRGGHGPATPSIANLNAMTAQLGVTVFLALVQGSLFGEWDFARFDQLTGETMVARTKRREDCPLCGTYGVLGLSDEQEEPSTSTRATEPEFTPFESSVEVPS